MHPIHGHKFFSKRERYSSVVWRASYVHRKAVFPKMHVVIVQPFEDSRAEPAVPLGHQGFMDKFRVQYGGCPFQRVNSYHFGRVYQPS